MRRGAYRLNCEEIDLLDISETLRVWDPNSKKGSQMVTERKVTTYNKPDISVIDPCEYNVIDCL